MKQNRNYQQRKTAKSSNTDVIILYKKVFHVCITRQTYIVYLRSSNKTIKVFLISQSVVGECCREWGCFWFYLTYFLNRSNFHILFFFFNMNVLMREIFSVITFVTKTNVKHRFHSRIRDILPYRFGDIDKRKKLNRRLVIR